MGDNAVATVATRQPIPLFFLNLKASPFSCSKDLHQCKNEDIKRPASEYLPDLRLGQWNGIPAVNSAHTSHVLCLLALPHPPCFGDIRVVGHGEETPERTPLLYVNKKCHGQDRTKMLYTYDRDNATEDEEPSPTTQSRCAIHATVNSCLKIPAEHASCVASRIEDSDTLSKF